MTISLEKENGMEWWKSIAEGEPEIDTTKVWPSSFACDTVAEVAHNNVRSMCVYV